MNRLPLLLIGLLLFIIAGCLVYLGINATYASSASFDYYSKYFLALIPIAFILVGILGFIISVWALVHMLTNQSIQGNDKIVWAIVIIFLNALGAILYFLISPSARLRDTNDHPRT